MRHPYDLNISHRKGKGIKEALEAKGIEVFITRVPRTGSLEQRAEVLAKQIEERFQGREVNLIGHSMVDIARARGISDV